MSTPNPAAIGAPPPAPAQIHPNTFDFLPDLHGIISRIFNDELDPKDVITQASLVRLKIQEARNVVKGLPQVDMTLEDQQREIEKLEARIAKQREILKGVGELDIVKDMVKKRGEGKMQVDS